MGGVHLIPAHVVSALKPYSTWAQYDWQQILGGWMQMGSTKAKCNEGWGVKWSFWYGHCFFCFESQLQITGTCTFLNILIDKVATQSSSSSPVINKLIQTPTKPSSIDHVGDIKNNPFASGWIEAIFEHFDKMHRSQTFSAPFLRDKLPPNTTILPPCIAFKVSITDNENYYELKPRLCLNGSKQ